MINVIISILTVFLSSWTMSREGTDVKYPVQVPTTVAGALVANGAIDKNVLESDNYFKVDKSIFDSAWIFETSFETPDCGNYSLNFNGLNYYADIYLNGVQLASADTTYGVFVRRSFNVSNIVRHSGSNDLKLRVKRAHMGTLNIGFVDWNPRPLDENMGIISDVSLERSGEVIIRDLYVKPELELPSLKNADIFVDVSVSNLENKPVNSILSIDFCGSRYELPLTLAANEDKTVHLSSREMSSLHLSNPRVWWTHDLGIPEMYSIKAIVNCNGKNSCEKSVDFGVRSITSHIDERGNRTFVLNGRQVLVKSAGWTDDIFLRDTHESNELQVRYAVDMGLNSIRFENIWGKDDNIYDLCDRYGLLALVGWSCQWEWEDYCGKKEKNPYGCIISEADNKLAARYFHDQVIRLHNHPSIMAWMVGSDRIPNPELENLYMEVYNKYDYRPYVCSAKNLTSALGGPSGTKMAGPYEYVGPEYWYMDTKCGGAFGFNSETGIGTNLPQLPSLQRMMPADSLWPLSTSYNMHCTTSSSAMNSTSTIVSVVSGQYGKPENLKQFVDRAHSADYESTRAMYESFRCNFPVATGIVQWMLNSAWPSLYWQLYDYYKLPTAAYYGVKKACRPIQLIYNYKDNAVYCVNESGLDFSGKAGIKIFDSNSKIILSNDVAVNSTDNVPVKLFSLPEKTSPSFLALSLNSNDGTEIADNFYCLPYSGNRHIWGKEKWYYTPISEYADLKYVSALPEAQLSMTTKKEGKKISVKLTNKSEVISYQNILRVVNVSGDVITPAFWSDNFVTLLPGQTRELVCNLDSELACNVVLDGWNSVLLDDGSRDRSKYANDSFSKDESYTYANPYTPVSVKQVKGKRIKNVILMIGDGMGVEQVSSAWVLNGGKLNIDNFKYTGFSRTYPVNKLVADSPSGGTALATGVKTKYGYEACGPDGEPVESVLTYAQKHGWKTGMVVTCRVNDATPFNFIGHSKDRSQEESGAAQYVESNLDFLSGGGLQFWVNRSDGRNLVEEMKSRGYAFAATQEELYSCKSDKIISLLADTEMLPSLDRGPYLEFATDKAIETLDNKNGFFLMVEGSCIDDWLHRHKMGYAAEELFDFDRTIGRVLEWAEKDGETLVVVTADHATAGMTILGGSIENRNVKVHFSTKGHNGILVPVFAYGPGAEKFVGVHENSEVGQIIRSLIK